LFPYTTLFRSRLPIARAEVVHRLQSLALAQCAGGNDVGVREVGDVDVVADARAIRGRVVVAEDLRRMPRDERVQHDGEQVVRGGIADIRVPGADDVEVAQARVREAMRPREIL